MRLELASPQRRIAFDDWAMPRPVQDDPVAGRMAHDMRNILHIISGNLALLSRTLGDDAAARKHIDRAMAGVDLGTRLTGSLLTDQDAQARAKTDIVAAKAAIESMLRDAVGEAVALKLDVPETLAFAAVDQTALENVLVNLAVNARHAMDGAGSFTVSFTQCEDAGRNCIEMTVADTGCGMPQQVIDRAFDPYFSTKGKKGSGLGLATVKRFVDGCDGSIAIQSVVGVGTTFRLCFPRTPLSS